MTFETRQQRVYRGPFISEDRNFDFSTTLFHVTMYRQFARKVGTSANSALICYYSPRLKLSSSTLALARERTPSVNTFEKLTNVITLFHSKSRSHSIIWTERVDDGCRRVNRDLHQSATVMSRRHRSRSVDDNNHVFCLRRSNLHIEWPTIKTTLITMLKSVIRNVYPSHPSARHRDGLT